MQSSKKAAECATPLILNRILPKCHPETRVWGYYKSEGIKSNFHLYKVVEGHDSCHTHTQLIELKWISRCQCESLSPDPARLVVRLGEGAPPSLHAGAHTAPTTRARACGVEWEGLAGNEHVQRRKTNASLWQASVSLSVKGDYNTCLRGNPEGVGALSVVPGTL